MHSHAQLGVVKGLTWASKVRRGPGAIKEGICQINVSLAFPVIKEEIFQHIRVSDHREEL